MPEKFAHFENTRPGNIYDLYTRHAEVCRDIHAAAASAFAGIDVEVELVSENIVIPREDIRALLDEYDVVSVSSALRDVDIGIIGVPVSSGSAFVDEIDDIMAHYNDGGQHPVIVSAAGNSREADTRDLFRYTNLMRTGLSVGEANRMDDVTFVEQHSSRSPTLSSTNPFNQGETFHYINMAPSLEGHERLIETYVKQKQFGELLEQFYEENPDFLEQASDYDKSHLNHLIKIIIDEVEEFKEKRAGLVQAYLDNPDSLHAEILEKLSEHYDFDENGFLTNLDGTSFSAPYVAGHISGALVLEEQRAEAGLPTLTREEITTLTKLATTDIQHRQNKDETGVNGMLVLDNPAGYHFSASGGLGYFDPELFRKLLDEAHARIEQDPDIDREIVQREVAGTLESYDTAAFNFSDVLDKEIVVERSILTFDTPDGIRPTAMSLTGQDDVSSSWNSFDTYLIGSTFFATGYRSVSAGDSLIGARLSGDSNLRLEAMGFERSKYFDEGEDEMVNPRMIIHGYVSGGLMDQMMAYRQELAAKADVQLDEKSDLKRAFDGARDVVVTDKTPEPRPEQQREFLVGVGGLSGPKF
ncbi:MAG: hypothetical protein GC137_10860 [Alphaproteobacteria bacterium]|nr:hypothetical protein [Alphaproteobacteria bacterium]